MANDCSYDMRVIGKSKEAVERMREILDSDDPEFFLYRVYDMTSPKREATKDKQFKQYWTLDYFGDVAWGPDSWIDDIARPDNKNEAGAHYSNLLEICKALKIGVEVWAEEVGNACQWHFIVNPSGEVSVDERYCNLNIEDDGEGGEKLVGGFDGDFLNWSPAGDIMETFESEDDEEDKEQTRKLTPVDIAETVSANINPLEIQD
jgi:hypothetical protein